MIITSIEKENKKYKIFIDDSYTFSLYFSEIKQYNLREQEEISSDTIEYIGSEIVVKRGMSYLNHLLAKRDYTKKELYEKLNKAGYIDAYIENITKKLEEKNLVNDLSYAKRFVEQMVSKKSRRWIILTLQQKGIEKEILDEALMGLELDEYDAAKNQLLKKVKNKNNLTFEEQGKLYSFLLRKGFTSSTIFKVMNDELNFIYGK